MKDLVRILNFLASTVALIAFLVGVIWYIVKIIGGGMALYTAPAIVAGIGVACFIIDFVTGKLLKKWGIENLSSDMNAGMMDKLAEYTGQNNEEEN